MIIECPHCSTPIIPLSDGTCPACGQPTRRVLQTPPPERPVVDQRQADPRGVSLQEFRHALLTLTPRIWVTRAIVAINVLVFLGMLARGVHPVSPAVDDLVRWGANFGPLTTSGQWWRLLTSTFLHIGIIHLGINMWVLWSVGRLVERLLGNSGFIVLYVLSGLAGSLGSVFWHENVVSAGASGAIFGVFGGLMGFVAPRRDSVPRQVLKGLQNSGVTFLAFNLIFGLTVPGIDMAAHLGGLVAGFLCGLAMSRPIRPEARSGRATRNVLVAAGGAALLVLAALAVPEAPARALPEAYGEAARLSNQGAEYLNSGQYDKAIAVCTRAIDLDPKLAMAYANRGGAYAGKGRFDQAVDDCTRAIDLDPKLVTAYVNRASVYLNSGKLDMAIADCDEALRLDPNSALAYANRGGAYAGKGRFDQAVDDCTQAIRVDPMLAIAYLNRGFAYLNTDRHDKTIDDCTTAIRLNPNLAFAYVNRGLAYVKKGDLQRASEEFKKARQIDPTLPDLSSAFDKD